MLYGTIVAISATLRSKLIRNVPFLHTAIAYYAHRVYNGIAEEILPLCNDIQTVADIISEKSDSRDFGSNFTILDRTLGF